MLKALKEFYTGTPTAEVRSTTLRRVLVALEVGDGCELASKKKRNTAISLLNTATNAELAEEVAKTFNIDKDSLCLEVNGRFELRPQDSIMSISDDEIVTARIIASNAPSEQQHSLKPTPSESTAHTPINVSDETQDGRQILFVTPELARRCANAHPTDAGEPTNDFGILAFKGARVSSQVTLHSLKLEASQALGFKLEAESASLDAEKCSKCKDSIEETCACATVTEITTHGLLSSMHCRLSIDGSPCAHGTRCPYSHDAIALDSTKPPHCSICEGALGFPCKLCESVGVDPAEQVYCPLVSNAGCGHLHHAHCLGLHLQVDSTRSLTSKPVACPSGCPLAQFPFEQRIFGLRLPHVILVWDGPTEQKIIYIPIPEHLYPSPPCSKAFKIDVSAIVTIVREHLIAQEIVVPECGLTISVPRRDPTTGMVLMTETTLVTVCAASCHGSGAAGRFQLFTPAPGYKPKHGPSATGAKPVDTQTELYSTIDFHTSRVPVFSTCDCATLGDLQLVTPGCTSAEPLVLYVVQRTAAKGEAAALPKTGKATFLNNPAWYPDGIKQTSRGIASLLSSLYVMAEAIAHGENCTQTTGNVLAMLYMVSRFPPAVRSVALIIKNKTLLPEEQAALASAMYHALKAFSYEGPSAIVNNVERTFEASRILLGWIMSASNPISLGSRDPAIEEISLLCASSGNRLRDPVRWGTYISERSFAMLHIPGALLYRPSSSHYTGDVQNFQPVDLDSDSVICQAVNAGKYLPSQTSLAVLHADRIGNAPSSCAIRIEVAGRDFNQSIRQANGTELVIRGPLDLKAPAIVAPQLVLDSDGFIAVFTGRGCGSTRDVNFFRPTASGDTEVDINDVANALDKIIPSRKAEKTWEIDTYSGVGAPTRDPEEAIVICLDLSQSMNQRSGVEDSHTLKMQEKRSSREEEDKRIKDLTSEMTDDELRNGACSLLDDNLDWSALVALRSYCQFRKSRNDYLDEDGDLSPAALRALIDELEAIARRDIITADTDEIGVAFTKHAAFVKICTEVPEFVQDYLSDAINDTDIDGEAIIGTEPFVIPRKFIDPKTGNILDDPCQPRQAPYGVFVSNSSLSWFDDLSYWPNGLFVQQQRSKKQLKFAISKWISGQDLLPRRGGSGQTLELTLDHNGKATSWQLSPTTTTRTLYSLVNRAVGATYSYFSLKRSDTFAWRVISDSESVTLSSAGLIDGHRIQIIHARPHIRTPFILSFESNATQVVLPSDATLLALFGFHHSYAFSLSKTTLWHGLRAVGDGSRVGRPFSAALSGTGSGASKLSSFLTSREQKLSCGPVHIPSSTVEESRYLTRLHLLTELFNVFLNRACSFDTTVPLVLGLVTFSNRANITQPLTPLFEKFREELGQVKAGGDTAVYDALDLARSMLVEYRTDIPNLRRRIIMVSDGQDTSSKESPLEVLAALQRNKITVDSVQVGPTVDAALHGISVVTGGYRFCPRTSLSDALSIFDLETVLSSGERPTPTIVMAPVRSLFSLISFYGNTSRYPVDVVTLDQFPKRAEHAKLFNKVKPLDLITNRPGRMRDDRLKRIMLEIHDLMKKTPDYMDIYVDESDITFLRIVMEAPKDEGCLYRNGVYFLTCDFPEGYPRDPPHIRFVNFIMHPNVSKQGKVCIAELGRLWSSDTKMETALQLVYQIFTHPDLENPLETQASMRYYDDNGEYAFAVAKAVSTHASKTRAEWRAELED
ncbi:hypothetical protein GYMLUDRAFT_48188 [Collybiopsis luxurians FD-317 M1]|uniref:UBC core domain-containing protein n=1 Tax=Collybiopsis luxurians FD-317 M1 TaxID=944289 RepID=A0A0D0AWR1_9AGAR|nr:hypothetical protein GYMLUDRAFT_48188 [Collybiopsis luxurians FD-317 M1]